MIEVITDTLFGQDAWKYISIPLVAAFVGWFTNWVAIQLTFYPLEFVGTPPFMGWQGIIPAKVEKMASIVVDQTLTKLGTLDEFFNEMEPDKIAHHLHHFLDERLETYTDEVMQEKNEVLWANLPLAVKRRFYSRTRKQLPKITSDLVNDIGGHIEELVDLKHMIVSQMSKDKALMNRVFFEVGQREFNFVIRSGAAFGFLFGLIQMFVWMFWSQNWILPAFGLLVGLATNWIALNLIFRPLNPLKVGPFVIQGLFLKRQQEVSATFCRLVTEEVLTIKRIVEEMVHGPRHDRTKILFKKHMKPIIDAASVRTIAQLTVGLSGYANLKQTLEDKAIEVSVEPFENKTFVKERAEVVAALFKERMSQLSPAEFQELLRPAFQEDEWILVLMGGILGALAGVSQLTFVF